MPRRRHHRPAAVLLLVLGLSIWAPAGTAAGSPVTSAHVNGSPFHPTNGAVPRRTGLVVELARPAELTVRIRDQSGSILVTLASRQHHEPGRVRSDWDGRRSTGAEVVNGAYRFELRAREDGVLYTSEFATTKADYAIYPANPRAILLAIDAGHGSPDSGAYYGGNRESDFNLDISRRLQAMLTGARVGVVLVRPIDRWLNVPEIDRTGDGVVDRSDDLQARLDLANPLRPDLMTIVMNNAYGCHCAHGTETFTHADRTWTPEALELGRLMQEEHIRLFDQYRSAQFTPTDRGARTSDRYYETRPYSKTRVPRPSSMVTVLVESMFMDQSAELALLRQPAVRQTIAEAYYNAIARYINDRPYGMRYEVVSAPTTATSGAAMSVEVKLTNRGVTPASGWKLRLGAVRAPTAVNGATLPPEPYDGSGAPGTQLARVDIPPLAPGRSATIHVDTTAPIGGGKWIVKVDTVLPGGQTLSARGVSMLQLPLKVKSADASSSPSIDPTPSTDPTPSEEPSPSDEPSAGVAGRSPDGWSLAPGALDEPLFCPVYDW